MVPLGRCLAVKNVVENVVENAVVEVVVQNSRCMGVVYLDWGGLWAVENAVANAVVVVQILQMNRTRCMGVARIIPTSRAYLAVENAVVAGVVGHLLVGLWI